MHSEWVHQVVDGPTFNSAQPPSGKEESTQAKGPKNLFFSFPVDKPDKVMSRTPDKKPSTSRESFPWGGEEENASGDDRKPAARDVSGGRGREQSSPSFSLGLSHDDDSDDDQPHGMVHQPPEPATEVLEKDGIGVVPAAEEMFHSFGNPPGFVGYHQHPMMQELMPPVAHGSPQPVASARSPASAAQFHVHQYSPHQQPPIHQASPAVPGYPYSSPHHAYPHPQAPPLPQPPLPQPPVPQFAAAAAAATRAQAARPAAGRRGGRRGGSRAGRARQGQRAPSQQQRPLLSPTAREIAAATSGRAQVALNIWYERLKELNAYRLKHGNCNVPQKWVQNTKLGIVRIKFVDIFGLCCSRVAHLLLLLTQSFGSGSISSAWRRSLWTTG